MHRLLASPLLVLRILERDLFGCSDAEAAGAAELWSPPTTIAPIIIHSAAGFPVLTTGDHEGALRRDVLRMKFRNDDAAAQRMLGRVVAALPAEWIGRDPLVVPVPTSFWRCVSRRGDHVSRLAKGLADRTGLEAVRALRTTRRPKQLGKGRSARLERVPRFCLRRNALSEISGRQILIIDDVVTTGGTMQQAGMVLQEAGAQGVMGVAVSFRPFRAN